VIDNCEHVIEQVRELVRGLSAASNVTVLATSRPPLDVTGEAVVRLGPLETDPARSLFERIAHDSGAAESALDGEQIDRICARLDGMPLAIELVARRIRSFSLQEIHQHLASLLHDSGDRPDRRTRHATMTSALAWSVELLSSDGCAAVASTAVFPGSFDIAAFEALVRTT